jgi:hypothetical protein
MVEKGGPVGQDGAVLRKAARATIPVSLAIVSLIGSGSAHAGKLAFVRSPCDENAVQCNDSRIWVADDRGGGLRQLTTDSESSIDYLPLWSSDGLSVVYNRRDGGSGRISTRIISAGGTGDRRLFPGPERHYTGAFEDWSPDGRWLANWTDDGIVLVSANGEREVPLTRHGPGLVDGEPTFTADSRRVVFERSRGGASYGPGLGLFSVALDGSGLEPVFTGTVPEQLTGSPGFFTPNSPGLSPDARLLGFGVGNSVYTLDAVLGELRRVTDQATYNARLAWVWKDSPGVIFQRNADLIRVDLRSGESRAVMSPEPGVSYRDPTWAPLVPIAPLPDLAPPVTTVIDPTEPQQSSDTSPVSSARRTLTVRRRNVRFLAADTAGIRRVKLAIAVRRGSRCRFLGSRRFTRRRSCRNAIYRNLRGARDFHRRVARLRRGTYRFLFQTQDGNGNRTRRPQIRTVRVRP